MKKRGTNANLFGHRVSQKEIDDLLRYPMNNEHISDKTGTNSTDEPQASNETDFDDATISNLDVPGSELDDQQESVGSEDEENNYYSLGGDDHNDLEESQ